MSSLAMPEYVWEENWGRIPDSESARQNGRTHGVGVTRNADVIVFHQAVNGLLVFDGDGNLRSASGGARWLGAHGLTIACENGNEYLWLTDQASTEVAKVTLDGKTVQRLPRPPHPVYTQGGAYVPTWAVSNPQGGDVWVADGYGSSLVHRFSAAGAYRGTLDGTEGAGRFNTPHGIQVREAPSGPELWIADRGNRRVAVYDGEGRFLRQIGVAHSPCAFDFQDGMALVPELFTGVKLLDADTLELLGEIGSNGEVSGDTRPEGWPDLAGTGHVKPGLFNSPHSACFTPEGDIIVVEWIIGGRITRLRRKKA
jgi:hypothetical protein